ncbi:MAG: hypothetical protein ACJ0OY_03580 [Dehalococcoidia bacterium]
MNDEIDPVEEYNRILDILDNARHTALKLKDEIAEFLLKSGQTKHLKIPIKQLQDMQLETQAKYLELHLEFVLNRLKK